MPDPIDELNSQENNTPLDSPAQQSNFNTVPISPAEPVSTVPSPPSEIASNPVNTPFVPDEGPKKSYKKLIIGVVAGFVALIGLGGGAAYAMYMNSPDKVLLDAAQNIMKTNTVVTKGTIKADSKQANAGIEIEFSSQSDNAKQAGSLDAKVEVRYMDTKLNLDGEGMMAESGSLYFKVDNSPELLDSALKSELGKTYASEPALAPTVEKFKAFFKKIDGKWIKIETTDIDQFSNHYSKLHACTKKVLAKFNKDENQQKQVTDTYTENPFITIEDTGKTATINSQSSTAYDISFDMHTAYIFGKELESTEIVAGVYKCSNTQPSNLKVPKSQVEAEQKMANSIKTTLWISKQSHELQKVDIENKDKKSGNFEFSVALDTKTQPNLRDPSKFLTFKELLSDINAIEADITTLTGGVYTRAGTPESLTNAIAVQKKAEAYAADHIGIYPNLEQLKAYQGLTKLPPELLASISSEAPDATHPERVQYIPCANSKGYSIYYWKQVAGGSVSDDLGYGCDN